MQAIKRIGNNAAVCVDSKGRQLVALGRGVGFGELPHEVSLADITRTFYDIDDKYLSFIEEVDPDVLEFSAQLADLATRQVSYELSPNLPVTLADHIQFAIKRAREHIPVSMPLAYDVEQSHPIEYKIGQIAVNGIQKTFHVGMKNDEAVGIALSIVNAAVRPSDTRVETDALENALLEQAVTIIERQAGVAVDRESFAYSRFATHFRYLLKRVENGENLETENSGLYEVMVEDYPISAQSANMINQTIRDALGAALEHEELVYLIMHINRIAPPTLCSNDASN